MNKMMGDLEHNPKWAALYLKDMMDIMQHRVDEDSLRRVVRYAKAYIRDMTEEEDDKEEGIKSCAPLRTLSNFVTM